jgi:hypothetical protein
MLVVVVAVVVAPAHQVVEVAAVEMAQIAAQPQQGALQILAAAAAALRQ